MSGAFKRRRTRSASLLHFPLCDKGLSKIIPAKPIGGNGVRVQFRASKNGVAVFFSRCEKSLSGASYESKSIMLSNKGKSYLFLKEKFTTLSRENSRILPPPGEISPIKTRVSEEYGSSVLRTRFSEFLRYGVIGIANTAVHAAVFFSLVSLLTLSQALGNCIAFFVAVTVSFFLNAHFTFRQRPTLSKFVRMTAVMALLSYASGRVGDVLSLNPVVTFLIWSAVSYVAGFLLTRYFVFRP